MASERLTSVEVGGKGLRVPSAWSMTVDVLFDDCRIFSIPPGRSSADSPETRVVHWPAALQSYLSGSTTVTLRAHVTGVVLFTQDVEFDPGPGRVRVIDEDGYPLAMTKWGTLARPFSASSPDAEDLLTDLEDLLRLLNDDLGVCAFLAYGTLLGAVRAGAFIGHDTDADISYYSKHQHPADILRESYWLQRRLQDHGWQVRRKTGAFVQVFAQEDVSTVRKIDIFTSYHIGDWFAMDRWVRQRVPRTAILPLGKVEFEGRELAAPNEPAAVLAATYGDDWRVPDPSFKFRPPHDTAARATGWFGGRGRNRGRWGNALAEGNSASDKEPSSFARWVDAGLSDREMVIDVGCGRGEDGLWLARDGRRVLGLDFVPQALREANSLAEDEHLLAGFESLDLYDLRTVLAKALSIASEAPAPCVYARHVLEALRPDGQENFWLFVRAVLGGGGRLFAEFHTGRGCVGPTAGSLLGELAPERVASAVAARGGVVLQQELSRATGASACRIVAAWDRRPPISSD